MSQKSAKISTVVSLILTFMLLLALVYLTYWLPDVVESMIDMKDNHFNTRAELTETGRTLILIDAYVMVAVAYIAVGVLFFLLRTVVRGEVLTKAATRLLTAVSWCCFAEGLLFILLAVQFQLAVAAAVAACFLGLCLRVVKNVIEEAIRIKSENDFTI